MTPASKFAILRKKQKIHLSLKLQTTHWGLEEGPKKPFQALYFLVFGA